MDSRRGSNSRLAAVLFTDIVGSTQIASAMGDRRWRELLSRHHKIIRQELKRHGGREHDTAGDGFFASFPAPADAIRCAVACAAGVRSLGVEIRAGVNFGEVEIFDGKPGGVVVHAGARLMSLAEAGQVLVSSSAHDVMPGAGLGFEDMGDHPLKGLDEQMHVYSVASADGVALRSPEPPEVAEERLRSIEASAVGQGRRWVLAGAGALVVLVGAWAWALFASEGPTARTKDRPPTSAVPPGSVAEIDPSTGSVEQVVPLGLPDQFIDVAHTLAGGLGAVWVVRNETIFHIDPGHSDLKQVFLISVLEMKSRANIIGLLQKWMNSHILVKLKKKIPIKLYIQSKQLKTPLKN